MNLLDKNVFTVLLAVLIIVSVTGIAWIVRSDILVSYSIANDKASYSGIKIVDRPVSPFVSIGLLNEKCMMGPYTKLYFEGENISLCLLFYNGYGYPVVLQARYKLVETSNEYPSESSPSPNPSLANYTVVLNPQNNYTLKITIPMDIDVPGSGRNITLVFELWRFDPVTDSWVYTGKWVHLHVKVVPAP